MNKKPYILVASVLAAFSVTTVARAADSFSGTGTAPVNIAIPAGAGKIVADAMVHSTVSNTTMTVYRPRGYATAAITTATTNLVLYTEASNTVAGVTLGEATDYVLVRNATSGYQLSRVEHVYSAAATNDTTTYALLTAVTATAGDKVFFVDTADNVSIPIVTTYAGLNIGGLFTGFGGMPVYLNIPGIAGTTTVAGSYHLEN